MKLKIRFLEWSAGFPVAMVNQETAESLNIKPKDRITIKTISSSPKEFSTIIDTVEDLIKKNEIVVSSELKEILKLKSGQFVHVNISANPQSLLYIKKKLNGHELNENEILYIIKDVVNNSLSEAEISLFVSAMYKNGMTMNETFSLIKALLASGKTIKFKNHIIADKHSIGGIPGNRTTPLVVSICAAAGLTIPKTSSRAITSAAGTADVIETIADVDISGDQLKKIVNKTGACMVWGGSLGLVPADDKIIQIEKVLHLDPEAQLLASIMSKKLAVGSKYILIDIPYGKSAKVDKKEALKLKKKFEAIGKHFKLHLRVVLTDGNQPIGNGIGPSLELIDIIEILDPEKQGPKALEKKAIYLSGQLLELTKKAKKGKGEKMAQEILYSGKAFEKFKEIIKAQNGSLSRITKAKFTKEIYAHRAGKVLEMNNKSLNFLGRILGSPVMKSAGIYLHVHVGDKVSKGQKIMTFHSESKERIEEAINFCKKSNPIRIK